MKLIDSVPERHSEREAVRLAEEKRLKEERERLQEEAERRRNGLLTNQLSVLSLIYFRSFVASSIHAISVSNPAQPNSTLSRMESKLLFSTSFKAGPFQSRVYINTNES